MKPLVAIVGRPNVGKSMLFNKLCGQRLSIVEDTPGVTRDRLYAECEWCGRSFNIVDTGGIEPSADTEILSFMRRQAEIAIQNATVIVFLCDIKTGLTASDQEVANMLLRSRKPVVLAVNKMDQVGPTNPDIYEFYNLGLGDPIPVSAVHGHGTGGVVDVHPLAAHGDDALDNGPLHVIELLGEHHHVSLPGRVADAPHHHPVPVPEGGLHGGPIHRRQAAQEQKYQHQGHRYGRQSLEPEIEADRQGLPICHASSRSA